MSHSERYSLAMLTGQDEHHLQPINDQGKAKLQHDAANAFCGLQQAAQKAGFNLQAASAYRSFARQQWLWNSKFSGALPLLDSNSQRVDSQQLPVAQRCQMMLHWSAMPGASRHHWGTDLDIYDPDRLPAGMTLQLIPSEYQAGGYFSELSQWLTQHMALFDFYRPFAQDRGGVAPELWHISYYPLAEQLLTKLTPEVLTAAWQDQPVAGKEWLIPQLPMIFERYIDNIDLPHAV